MPVLLDIYDNCVELLLLELFTRLGRYASSASLMPFSRTSSMKKFPPEISGKNEPISDSRWSSSDYPLSRGATNSFDVQRRQKEATAERDGWKPDAQKCERAPSCSKIRRKRFAETSAVYVPLPMLHVTRREMTHYRKSERFYRDNRRNGRHTRELTRATFHAFALAFANDRALPRFVFLVCHHVVLVR